ncbi:MAG: hypothetical protein GY936_02230 [Ignavibacteriae bacterium]|nr:hypothetical protein [Ignavibacteriota bacterium]
MKKVIILFAIFLLFSCTEQDKNDFQVDKKVTAKYNIETFAVIWTTITLQKDKMVEHLPAQTKQLRDLWDKGIVENIYFKTDEKFHDGETWPNIMFFIKAKDEEAATEILNEMDFVKYKLANYELHPVGVLWLTRNDNSLEKVQKSKKSFGVVWFQDELKHFQEKDITLQSEGLTKLWKEGFIENVYFDATGASTGEKDRPTVVNFVNAENEKEAHKILDQLHVVKENFSTYMLFDVGVLWLGKNK